jgi:hypothetical protein
VAQQGPARPAFFDSILLSSRTPGSLRYWLGYWTNDAQAIAHGGCAHKSVTSASRSRDFTGIGNSGRVEHHRHVKHFRTLAAVLGCLAVLAGGFMTVAAAAASMPPGTEKSAIGDQPCSHCDDCGGASCPAPTVTCLQACTSVAPSLAVAAFWLPAVETGSASLSLRAIILSGLSPPPDPFPPRV